MRQEELQHIKRGDIIELARLTGELSKQLSETVDEESYRVEGYLFEVTGIGENSILGYALEGTPKKITPTDYNYGSFVWSKIDNDWEQHVTSYHYIRTVGRKMDNDYWWFYPNDVNIYTRCQSKISEINRDLLYQLKDIS